MVMPGLSPEELATAPSTFQVLCLGSATVPNAYLLRCRNVYQVLQYTLFFAVSHAVCIMMVFAVDLGGCPWLYMGSCLELALYLRVFCCRVVNVLTFWAARDHRVIIIIQVSIIVVIVIAVLILICVCVCFSFSAVRV